MLEDDGRTGKVECLLLFVSSVPAVISMSTIAFLLLGPVSLFTLRFLCLLFCADEGFYPIFVCLLLLPRLGLPLPLPSWCFPTSQAVQLPSCKVFIGKVIVKKAKFKAVAAVRRDVACSKMPKAKTWPIQYNTIHPALCPQMLVEAY